MDSSQPTRPKAIGGMAEADTVPSPVLPDSVVSGVGGNAGPEEPTPRLKCRTSFFTLCARDAMYGSTPVEGRTVR